MGFDSLLELLLPVRTGFDSRLVLLLPVSAGFIFLDPVSSSNVGRARGLWIRTRFLNNSFLLSCNFFLSNSSSTLNLAFCLFFLAPGTNLLLTGLVLTLEFNSFTASKGEPELCGLRIL